MALSIWHSRWGGRPLMNERPLSISESAVRQREADNMKSGKVVIERLVSKFFFARSNPRVGIHPQEKR